MPTLALLKGIGTNLLCRIAPVQTGNIGRSLQMRVGVVSGAYDARCLHREDLSKQALPAPSLSCPPHARQGAAGPSICFSRRGLGRRDEPEPLQQRGSQAVQTLTHSCLEQRRGLPPPFLLRGGRAANGLRGRLAGGQNSRGYGPSARSSAGLRGPGRFRSRAACSRPVPGRSFRGRRQGGVCARVLSLASGLGVRSPRTPGARAWLASGRRTPWSPGWPRRPAGRAATGALADDLARAK